MRVVTFIYFHSLTTQVVMSDIVREDKHDVGDPVIPLGVAASRCGHDRGPRDNPFQETSSRHRRFPLVALHMCCRVILTPDQQGAATPCFLSDKLKGFYVK
jgi:hypothetical protein